MVNNGSEWYAPLVWPAFVLAGVLVLFTRRGRAIARHLTGRVESIDVFGVVGLKLNAETSDRIKRTLQGLINDYRDEADRRLASLSAKHGLDAKLRLLAEDHVRAHVRGEFRCAIYVQDVIFNEGIAQITNYYPGNEGIGRVVGKWFGHVGRSFRADESRIDTDVTADPRLLVDEYGMTPVEADPGDEGKAPRRSFACVMIPNPSQGVRTAVYVDGVDANAFAPSATGFEEVIKKGVESVDLDKALARVATAIQEIGLEIDVKLARKRVGRAA